MSFFPYSAAGSDHPSLRDRVYQHLAAVLQSRPLHQAVCLDQDAICQELRISRTPLRDALLRLEQEGMLEIRPRRGVFLRPVSRAELAEICRLLGLLEADALESAFPLRHDVMLPALESSLQEQRHFAQAQDTAGFRRAERMFHKTLQETSHKTWRDALTDPLYRRLDVLPCSRDVALHRCTSVLAVHERILDSLLRGNVAAAASILRYEYWVPESFGAVFAGHAGDVRPASQLPEPTAA